MRLTQLELLAFGPFRGYRLDFSRPGMHVVLGRNEAGKSTTLRAITALLYGVDPRTTDAHLHKFSELRIGGVVEALGERLAVVRRKGNANTLLDSQGNPLDERALKRLCGGVSRETFVRAFGLDHGALEAGAKALLDGQGDLGESLFDASVGGAGNVHRLIAELSAEADRIFKPRATTLPLNDALKSFADAQRSVRERESRPEAFVRQEQALESAQRERLAKLAEKRELELRCSRLERAIRRAPLERRHARALERYKKLGAIVHQGARIVSLKERASTVERILEQARALHAEVARLERRIEEARLRAGIPAEKLPESLALDARMSARIHALVRERALLTERIETEEVEIFGLERELARRAKNLSVSNANGIPPLAGAGTAVVLGAALERARALGDAEARMAAESVRIERRAHELEERVATIGLFSGTLADLVVLPLPSVESVDRLASRAEELGRHIARAEERVADLERESAAIEKQRALGAGDFAPPDAAALAAAREARDRAWRALRGETNALARREAESEVERWLYEADSLADRMIREADRVTTLARLRAEAETNARLLERALEERARLHGERRALDDELRALFAPSRIAPTSFSDMCEWLERHHQIVDSYRTVMEARALADEEAAKVVSAKRDLAAALGLADAESAESARLSELVAVAAHRSSELDEDRKQAEEASKAFAELTRKHDERVANRERDEGALRDVETKLDALVEPFGLAREAAAEEIQQTLEAIRELVDLTTRRAEAEVRAQASSVEIEAFDAELLRAIHEFAPDLEGLPPNDAAASLFARGTEAMALNAELDALDLQLTTEASVVLDEADQALLSDIDAAESVVRELSEQSDELEDAITRLTEDVGGLRAGLDAMRAESHAAEAAMTAELQLARVRDGAERWCRLKIAETVLQREIERYRQEHQGPLLATTSALFARLTRGAFSGVKAGFTEDDRPCLRCVRSETPVDVDVTGLSDGTRDQLYLSLRLASLLRRAESSEPMPLVLDDVLIHFDDERASAALSVLGEVSRKMQVLFFTHHARLVELARASIPSEELVVHEMNREVQPTASA
jgi:uncharacterized protein YhaN